MVAELLIRAPFTNCNDKAPTLIPVVQPTSLEVMNTSSSLPSHDDWAAPRASGPLKHALQLPGSKSLTNRELVLSALADAPSRLLKPLHSRDSRLMIAGLIQLGARIEQVHGTGLYGDDLVITPGRSSDDVSVDVGLAGTAMRFLPLVAALGRGRTHFDGDPHARMRPMRETIESLRALGAGVDDNGSGTLPFTVDGTGTLAGGELTIDASRSSQFVSALLLAAPRFSSGLTLVHEGDRLPSLPHIEMTLETLRARGVDATAIAEDRWRVEPGAIQGVEVVIEPDLSNAAPFLASPLIAGGSVTIEDWPEKTTQVGALLPEILTRLGADVAVSDGRCTVTAREGYLQGGRGAGGTIDLGHAGELSPTIAVLGTVCDAPLTITGIGHTRGHETDRLEALQTNLRRLGVQCTTTPDSITVAPANVAELRECEWEAYADHRIATAGALLGLAFDIHVDDIDATSKTIPEFADLWSTMTDSASA